MARNIRKYGYGPNRTSDMPAVIVMAHHRSAYARFVELRDRRAARLAIDGRAPGTSMLDGARIWAYYRQNGTPRRSLTPRQQRRRWHKDPSLRMPRTG